MFKKLHIYFLLGLGLTTVFLITMLNVIDTKNSKKQREISTRAEYEEFLAQHPFNNRKIDFAKWKKIPKQERPDLAWEQDYLATMNPATGRPEREKLTPILQMTKAMMLTSSSRLPGGTDVGEAWVERGPNNVGGRTRAIAWDPTTTNKVWVGGVTGGLWYNSDITSSGSWIKVDDFWDNIAISCIAFDPNNANTIYVGTGEGFGSGSSRGAGIWKSTNGGSTWSQLSSTTSFYYVNDLVVNNEAGTSVVYAAVSGQHYMGTWHGTADEGLQRSTDGGNIWTQVMPSVSVNPVTPADIEIAADGEIWVGTRNNLFGFGGGRVYSSTNGTTWTLDHTHSSSNRVELACAPTDADYVYAIFESSDVVSAIKRTTNDGTNWASLSEPNDDDTNIPSTDFSNGQASYNLIIQVDSNDKDVAIAGGIDLFRTSDGGSTWNQLSHWYGGFGHPNVHADQHQIIFKPGASTTAIFGNDGGVYYSSNLTSANPSFSTKNNGYNVTQFYSCAIHPDAGSNKFMAGSQDNGTQVFSTAGMNSTVDPIGGDGAYCHFLQTNGNYAIGSYVYNNYYQSTNSGTSFSGSAIGGDDNTGSFINPSDFHDALAIQYSAKDNTTLKKITDIDGTPAASDVSLPSSTGSTVTHIRCSEYTTATTTLFLGTSGGSLWKVENADGTPTMTDISGDSFPNGSISCVDLGSSENELIVTFSNYGVNSVWYSTDGGTSWASREGDLPDMPVRWVLMNPHSNQKVILATEVGVWATTNFQSASPNWTASNSGLANVRVDMLKYRPSDDVVIAATHGRGLFSSKFESSVACPTPTTLTATSITATSADLGWTEAGSATTWDIEWGASGFTPTGTATISGTTSNPYNLTGLTGATAYDFYVRADCGSGDLSTWSGLYTFTTSCSVATAPYTEDFTSGTLPTCWSTYNTNGSLWTHASSFSYNNAECTAPGDHTTSSSGTSGFFAVDMSSGDVGVVMEMVDVDVSALTVPQLSFWYNMCGSGYTPPNELHVESWDGTAWNSLDSITTATTGWQEFTYTLTGHTYGASLVKIRFRAESGGSSDDFYGDHGIDDISIIEGPTCPAPTSLTATSITVTSADLGWTEGGTATTWDIEWGASGFTPTGTPTITRINTNPHNLTDLTASTIYDFYVRADCGGGDLSTWAGPYTFTTSCATVTSFPFTETFEISSSTLNCWTQIQEAGSGDWTYNTGSSGGSITTAHGGSQNARFVSIGPADGGTPVTKLVSPLMDLSSLIEPQLNFYYGQEFWAPDQNETKVYYSADGGTTWTEIAHYTTSVSSWTEETLALPNPSSTYKIAFEGINNYGRANVIDDVSIMDTFIKWTGTTDTDWTTASNWSSGTVPTASTKVSIPSGLTNYPTAAYSVTVNSVSIASGATLIAQNTFTGTITYNRNLATDNWYLVSSPVLGETIQNLIANHTFATGTAPNIGIAPYDNSQAAINGRWDYQTLGSTGSVIVGKGYSVKLNATGDISFTGTLNTSDVTIALIQGSGGGGDDFNLLGNPFTSFINSDDFLTTNTAELTSQTIWLWNQATNSYDTKVTVDAFKVAPSQGFFVEANTTNNVTFVESIQGHKTTDTFQRDSRPEVHLFLNDDENNVRYSKIYYINGTTTGFDNGYDGELFGGSQNSFEIYSHLLSDNQNKKYQIQSLPNSDYELMVIPVGLKAAVGKEITFSVEAFNLPADLKVFLEDKEANIFTRLDEVDSAYRVTLTESLDGVGRFYLHTSANALSVDDVTLNTVHVYKSDISMVRIVGLPQGNTTVKIYNVLGKELMSSSFDDDAKDISLPKLAKGVYIVDVQTEIGKLSKKIILE